MSAERRFNHVGRVPSKGNSFAGGDFEERGCSLLGLGDGEDAGWGCGLDEDEAKARGRSGCGCRG